MTATIEYSWEFDRVGGTLTQLATEKTIYLQGDDATNFDMEFQALQSVPQVLNSVCGEYFPGDTVTGYNSFGN